MLYSSLQPLAILTKLVQSKSSLISAYGPILWAVKSHIEFIGNKMDLTDRSFDVNIPLQKVEKYIISIKDKYPIVGLASVFHFDGQLFLEVFNINVVDKLVELAVKIGSFETDNGPGKMKTGNATYKRRFANLVVVERKVEAPAKVAPEVSHDLTEEISEYLKVLIETKLAEFQNFFFDGTEVEAQKLAAKHHLSTKITDEGMVFVKRSGCTITELPHIEAMSILTEASLKCIEAYRKSARNPLSKFYHRSVLPPLIAFIFSMSAISVNCERSFSDLNQRLGSKRHNLSDDSLYAGLLISGMINTFDLSRSLEELDRPLSELLR